MLDYKTIGYSDPKWNEYLYRFPEQFHDINFTSQYHDLMKERREGIPELFVAEEGEKIYFHPYMINRIDSIGSIKLSEDIYDIQSVFGYTGPIVNTNDSKFIENANKLFTDACVENNVIVEFVRFNPLLKNHLHYSSFPYLSIFPLKQYVFIDLSRTKEQIFRNYHPKLRENLNSAGRDLQWDFVISNQKGFYDKLVILIERHLRTLGVDKYYFNSPEYYEKLFHFIQHNGQIFGAVDKITEELLSGEIFVFDKNTVYYLHTAYSSRDTRTSSIHKLVIHKAFMHFKDNGYKNICFGGGVSNSSNDNLFRYKKKFSGYTECFHLAKRIMNKDAYNNLCNIWENEYPQLREKRGDLILKYRFTD